MSGAANQTNAAIEIRLGEGAVLDRVCVQAESLETLHLSSLAISLGREAELRSFALAAGSAVARNQLFVTYAGEDAKVLMSGATLLAGKRHSDTTLVVDHAVPGGESREIFHAVLDGASRSVFQGKIIVRPGAQKTDGRMMSRAIMLSDEAEVDSKPELEIFADDVECGSWRDSAASSTRTSSSTSRPGAFPLPRRRRFSCRLSSERPSRPFPTKACGKA